MEKEESNFLYHSSCSACGSSDANSVYDDGHAYCFSCGVTTREETIKPVQNIQDKKFINGTIKVASPISCTKGFNSDIKAVTCSDFFFWLR